MQNYLGVPKIQWPKLKSGSVSAHSKLQHLISYYWVILILVSDFHCN